MSARGWYGGQVGRRPAALAIIRVFGCRGFGGFGMVKGRGLKLTWPMVQTCGSSALEDGSMGFGFGVGWIWGGDLRFGGSGLGFRVSGFGFRVSGLSGFGRG